MPQGLRLHETKQTVHTIGEYIRRNQERQNTPARLKDGKWTYYIDGLWVSKEQFEVLRPKVTYKPFNWKGEDIGRYAKL